MIKILLGGSPCTFWSIAQSKNRETKAEGKGWELFKNYLIAKEKFQPDFFLYENNWSASKAIKEQIQQELDHRLVRINSALVSAQSRDRFYVFNWEVDETRDRGILLRDILENDVQPIILFNLYGGFGEKKPRVFKFKSPTLRTASGGGNIPSALLKGFTLEDDCETNVDARKASRLLTPVECERLQTLPCTKTALMFDFEKMEVYSDKWFTEHQSKNVQSVEEKCHKLQRLVFLAEKLEKEGYAQYVVRNSSLNLQRTKRHVPSNVLTYTEEESNLINYSEEKLKNANNVEKNLEFLKVGQNEDFAQLIVGMHSLLTKTQHLGKVELHQNGKRFAKVENGKMQLLLSGKEIMQLAEDAVKNMNTSLKHIISTISEVGQNIKKLERTLTTLFFFALNVTDLFTHLITQKKVLLLTDREYTAAVSNTQRYRGLGNGWTAEVIIHILQGALKDVPKDEKIVVLSMYDGIGTGRYCLDKMGFTNVDYHAYEIDKYAIQVAMSNYPDIIQHGDAFQVRENDWKLM